MPTPGPRIGCKIVTKRYFVCPECNQGEFQCEHMFQPPIRPLSSSVSNGGPWYCDQCGAGWLVYTDGDGLYVNSWDRELGRYVVLEFAPSDKPIRIVVEGYRKSSECERDPEDVSSGQRYHYEEGTCPENYLRAVCEVAHGDEIDPHGLFELIGSFDTEEEAKAFMIMKGGNPQDQQ